MYDPSGLDNAFKAFPNVTTELTEVECGTFCSGNEFDSYCFAGPALRLSFIDSDLALIALWSDLHSELPSYPVGTYEICVVPEGEGFRSRLHGWFTGAQRVGGRPFGIGPNFMNLEHRGEWESYLEALRNIGDSRHVEASVVREVAEQEGLPRLVYNYARDLVALHESRKPKYVCPACYDPTCPATVDRGADCINTGVL